MAVEVQKILFSRLNKCTQHDPMDVAVREAREVVW
jgi:hypothetical protein